MNGKNMDTMKIMMVRVCVLVELQSTDLYTGAPISIYNNTILITRVASVSFPAVGVRLFLNKHL